MSSVLFVSTNGRSPAVNLRDALLTGQAVPQASTTTISMTMPRTCRRCAACASLIVAPDVVSAATVDPADPFTEPPKIPAPAML